MHTSSSEEKKPRDLANPFTLFDEVRAYKLKVILYLDQLDTRGLPTAMKELKTSCSLLPKILENYELALDEYRNFTDRKEPTSNRLLHAYNQVIHNLKNFWDPDLLDNFKLSFESLRATASFSYAKNFNTYFKIAHEQLKKLKGEIVPLINQLSEGKKISNVILENAEILCGYIDETMNLLYLMSEMYLQQKNCFDHDYINEIEMQNNRIKLAKQHQQDLIWHFGSNNGFALVPWCTFLRMEPLGAWCSVFHKKRDSLTSLLRDKILNPLFSLSINPAKLDNLDGVYKDHLRLLKSRNPHSDTYAIIVHLYRFFTKNELTVEFNSDKLVNVCEQIRRLREDAKSVAIKKMFNNLKQKRNVIENKSKYENLSEDQVDLFLKDALQFLIGSEFILKFDELAFLKKYFQTTDVDPELRNNLANYISEASWYCQTFLRHRELISTACLSLYKIFRRDIKDLTDVILYERAKGLQLVLMLTLEHVKLDLTLASSLSSEEVMKLSDLLTDLGQILELQENARSQLKNSK